MNVFLVYKLYKPYELYGFFCYFNQGFATVEYVAAALLDMDWYSNTEVKDFDINAFEKASMDKYGLIREILPRYRSTYFSHIFDGGYSAGYYVYLWAEVLDADAFQAFKSSGDIYKICFV